MDKFDEKVIGYESTKEILRQILDILKRPETYKRKGISIPRGLLMKSDPGLGKSLLASILMEESERKPFVFRKTSQENSFLDELRTVFAMAKEEAPSILLLWGHFISGDDVLLRQLRQHPNLLAALQGTSSFISDTFTQQIIGELECIFVLHDAITVRYDTKHSIIGAADIGTVAGNHSTSAGVDVAALDLPIQTGQLQCLMACRGIHDNTAKAVPRGFADREHSFNICRHSKISFSN